MQKQTVKEQVARVMAFIKDNYPKWITYREVMYRFDIGATKAQELCKTAADINENYVYDRGKIRYTKDPVLTDMAAYYDEKEQANNKEAEKPVPIGVGEAHIIAKILTASTSPPEDKGSLKMPKKPKEKWTPNDQYHR